MRRSYNKLIVWSLTALLGVTSIAPLWAGPVPSFDGVNSFAAPQPTREAGVNTNWGFGRFENTYNDLIISAVGGQWNRTEATLPPLLYKSLLATESSFNATAVSRSGAAGLAQLMPDTAKRFGLDSQQRFDVELALPVGIQVLQEKFRAIHDPGNYYALCGMPNKIAPWGVKVANYYQTVGQPNGEDRWALVLGAYNGGGGTILRAMSYAIDQGVDPRQWDALAGPEKAQKGTPLHLACNEVFGPNNGLRKAGELAYYPRKILRLYHQANPNERLN
jgi:hypothetical protein